jgi:hypothetical protein
MQKLVHVAVPFERGERRLVLRALLHQGVDIVPVAPVRRHPPSRSVRMAQQAERLQVRQLSPDRGAARVHLVGQSMATHGCARGDVDLQRLQQQLALPLRKLDVHHNGHDFSTLPTAACQHASAYRPTLVSTLKPSAFARQHASPFGLAFRKSSRGEAASVELDRLGQRFVVRDRARPEREIAERRRSRRADKRRLKA